MPSILARLILAFGASAAASSAPAIAGPISGRLLAGVTKAFGEPPIAVILWPAEGRTPSLPVAAEALPDGSLLAWLTPDQVAALADNSDIAFAAPQDVIDAPTIEADETPGADEAEASGAEKTIRLRPWPAANGAGVRIGIIDFGGLPPNAPAQRAVVSNSRFGRGDFSGRHLDDVVSIIHRMAPGAALFVASLPSSGASSGEIIRAANWLAEQGVRIVNFSGASYQSRRDGRAPLDLTVNELGKRGILWVSAAGNEAERSWAGPIRDVDRDGLIDIAGAPDGDSILLRATGGPVTLSLTWDDWGSGYLPRGSWDVEIALYDMAGAVIGRADNHRWFGLGEPVQTLTRVLAAGTYRVRLSGQGDGSPCLAHLVATGAVSRIEPSTPSGSIGTPGTAMRALTVGAVAQPRFRIAAYSGRGPTIDGRAKPDTAAIGAAGGSAGTSFAVPRITALAARILAENPGFGPERLKSEILGFALPTAREPTQAGASPTWIDSRGMDITAPR